MTALALTWLGASSAGCEPARREVTIDLVARVGDSPFQCGVAFDGIGTSATSLMLEDFRFYVHDVRAITAGGEVPIELADDGVWQDGGVALIDFEGGDPCGGNAPTNTRLIGSVPADAAPITGIRFRLGVPPERNHLDSATAPSPLNGTDMFWGWQAGYKYVRIEGATTGQPAYRFHLGAMSCSGEASMGTRVCAAPNLADIELTDMDPASRVIVADLASLFATSDLDVNQGGSQGCQSDVDDPDCALLFDAIGVSSAAGGQSLFRSEPRLTR